MAIQVAVLQLLQSPLTTHVCAAGTGRRRSPYSGRGLGTILWKAGLLFVVWFALQMAALMQLFGG